jgi:hypothetical protein
VAGDDRDRIGPGQVPSDVVAPPLGDGPWDVPAAYGGRPVGYGPPSRRQGRALRWVAPIVVVVLLGIMVIATIFGVIVDSQDEDPPARPTPSSVPLPTTGPT